jgi:hypothetical protein
MVRVTQQERRVCEGCLILGRPPRPHKKQPSEGRQPLQDVTNRQKDKDKHKYAKKVQAKCAQCNTWLCVHGDCWGVYHRSRKRS